MARAGRAATVTRLPVQHRAKIIRDCHQEGHWWSNPDGWLKKDTPETGPHNRKEQDCMRGCGCRRILRMTLGTHLPIGKPYIEYPEDYRYPQRVTRWELRAEEAGGVQ